MRPSYHRCISDAHWYEIARVYCSGQQVPFHRLSRAKQRRLNRLAEYNYRAAGPVSLQRVEEFLP